MVHEYIAIMNCSRHRFVKKDKYQKRLRIECAGTGRILPPATNSSWPWTLFSIDREKVEHGQVLAPPHMSEIACDVICAGTSATSGSYHQKRVRLHLHVDKHVQPHHECSELIVSLRFMGIRKAGGRQESNHYIFLLLN